ncbi:FxsA family protein [Labrys wisconsinensis]|uniref:UPF0716 protein FxsA n=1 Tax=Labrys wisconsinensis TaxID=425677 RepID=A0ABU0JGL0_9HYPH|nr:FxsA family protein [Labrys wisconsinensis]MDQ0472528.1 UPF0716 protein FxsA [Labrys wisconsinensis]
MTTQTQAAIPLWPLLAGLLALPFVEFVAFFWVAGRIGLLPALLALVATSFIGVSLLRRQGGEALARLISAFQRGEPPHGAARESFLVALGGVLMILPGFVSDAVGFALMLPSLLRSWSAGTVPAEPGPRRPPADPNGRVIDLDRGEWRPLDEKRPGA